MSQQKDFHLPEKLIEKTQEIDNEARISKEGEMEKNYKSEAHNSVRYPAKLYFINKRSKLASKCHHENKLYLVNYKIIPPNS